MQKHWLKFLIMISGKSVSSDTSFTGIFASCKALAVPPVDIMFMFNLCSLRAKSTNPVLSDTEINAVCGDFFIVFNISLRNAHYTSRY